MQSSSPPQLHLLSARHKRYVANAKFYRTTSTASGSENRNPQQCVEKKTGAPRPRKNRLQPLSYEEFKEARRTGNLSTALVKCHEGITTRLLSIEEIKELQAKNRAGKEIHTKKNGEQKRDCKDKVVARQVDLSEVFSIFQHDAAAALACEELSNGEMKGLLVCAVEQQAKESLMLPQEMPQQLEVDSSVSGRTTLDTNDDSVVQVQDSSEEVETPTKQVYRDDDESEFCQSIDEFSNFGASPVRNPSTQNISPFQTVRVSIPRCSGLSFTDADVLSMTDHEDLAEAAVFQLKNGVQHDRSTGSTTRISSLSLKKNTTFTSVLKAGRKVLLRMCSSKANERSTACQTIPISNPAPFASASISVASNSLASPVQDAPPRVNFCGANGSAADGHDDSPPQPINSIFVYPVATDEGDDASLIVEAVRDDSDSNKAVLVFTPRNHAIDADHEEALFKNDSGMSINNLQATPLHIMQVERGGYVLSPNSTAAREVGNIFRCLSGSGSSIGSRIEDGLEQSSTFDNRPASPPSMLLLDTEHDFTGSEEGEEASPRSFIGWISIVSPERQPALDSKESAGNVTLRIAAINRRLSWTSDENSSKHRPSKNFGNSQQYIRSVPIGIAKTKSRDSVDSTTFSLPS